MSDKQPVDISTPFEYCAKCNGHHHPKYPYCKEFTLESALDYLRAHNDGVYKITASKNLDALVLWLLNYLQRPIERESGKRYVEVKAFWEAYRTIDKTLCPEHEKPCTDVFRKAMDAAITEIEGGTS